MSENVRDRPGWRVAPPNGRRGAARVRPYVAGRSAPAPARASVHSGLAPARPVPPAPMAGAVPPGGGLDDVRAGLAGPVRRLLDARPDLGRPVPGDLLAGV
ncbi:hypothetical protein HNR25_001605 [Streptomonospora salina]|uniref:Uncharacterized protein n=1 Tax=Streptomonospora salina TaxID=104205 RepID=A0A841E5X3_9ACTN|nr:hypothetical protein [Streptomonospora salina]